MQIIGADIRYSATYRSHWKKTEAKRSDGFEKFEAGPWQGRVRDLGWKGYLRRDLSWWVSMPSLWRYAPLFSLLLPTMLEMLIASDLDNAGFIWYVWSLSSCCQIRIAANSFFFYSFTNVVQDILTWFRGIFHLQPILIVYWSYADIFWGSSEALAQVPPPDLDFRISLWWRPQKK